jgi:hypothetical protein
METTKIWFVRSRVENYVCLPGTGPELVTDRKHDLRVIFGKLPSPYPAYSIVHCSIPLHVGIEPQFAYLIIKLAEAGLYVCSFNNPMHP